MSLCLYQGHGNSPLFAAPRPTRPKGGRLWAWGLVLVHPTCAAGGAGTRELCWPPAQCHHQPGQQVPCTCCRGAAAQPATLQLPRSLLALPDPLSTSQDLSKEKWSRGKGATGLARPLAQCAGEGTVIGQGKAAGRRVAGAGRGSGSEELGLCGFPLPAALCRTCSGGCHTALQAGAHLQPRSEGWCLGRESVGAEPKESTGGYREQDRDQAPKFTTSSPSLVPTFLPPHHPPRPSPRCPVGRGSFRGTSKG